jgi:hypothetical protein
VCAYDYRDESGVKLYENVRLEIGHNGSRTKTFRPRRADGRGGSVENLNGVRRVLYRLDALAAAGPEIDAHGCEGEKDADRLASLGLISFSVADNALDQLGVLRGRRVFIHEDNDDAGKRKSAKLKEALTGIAASVVIVRYPDTPPHGDVSDWLDRGHDLKALLERCEAAAAEQRIKGGPIEWPEAKSGAPRARSQPNILTFLEHRNIRLRYNAFTSREVISIDGGNEQELDDATMRRLRLEADELGLIVPREFFEDVILNHARRDSFHPPREYLDGLQWDRQPRLDRWLVTYAGAKDTELTRMFGRKHLVAGVRRLRRPGCKHDAMIVLEGDQGVGKSTLIRILGGEFFSDSLSIGEDPRTVIERMEGTWIAEAAELTGLGKRESEQVKAMLSRQSDRARPAYGRRSIDRPRQFILFGSVNDTQYLRDPTGNRRFWPVRVGNVDLTELQRDRDQLWAEAAHFEATGESLELPPELWTVAAQEQEQRVITDPWLMILEPLLVGKKGFVEIADINRVLMLEPKHQNGPAGQRIAAILRQLGYEKARVQRNGKRAWCYGRNTEGNGPWISL